MNLFGDLSNWFKDVVNGVEGAIGIKQPAPQQQPQQGQGAPQPQQLQVQQPQQQPQILLPQAQPKPQLPGTPNQTPANQAQPQMQQSPQPTLHFTPFSQNPQQDGKNFINDLQQSAQQSPYHQAPMQPGANPIVQGVADNFVKPVVQVAQKAAHTVEALGSGANALVGAATNNPQAEQHAYQSMQADLQPGRAFINQQQAATQGQGFKGVETIAKPIVSGVAQIAPFVAGPAIGEAAQGLGTAARIAVNAAGAGAVNAGSAAAQQFADTGHINPIDVAKSGALGAGMGLAGEALHAGAGRIISDPDIRAAAESIAQQNNALIHDQRGAISLPGGNEDPLMNNTANRPYADVQRAIEDAHNAGNNDLAAKIINEQVPIADQSAMRSALGIPEPEPSMQSVGNILENRAYPAVNNAPPAARDVRPADNLDPNKGPIISQTKPTIPGAPVEVVRLVGRDENGPIVSRQLVDSRTDRPVNEAQQYAETWGITRQQAEKELEEMRKHDEVHGDMASLMETADREHPINTVDRNGGWLSPEDRRQIIRDNPQFQETHNQVTFDVQPGNIKGAIARATGIVAERDARLANAYRAIHSLSENDKALFYRWDDGEDALALAREAENPQKFLKAIQTDEDAFDYHLAADRAAGGTTLRQNNYAMPKIFKLSPQEMDEQGIPEYERYTQGEYTGYHDTSSKYRSYLDAYRQKGLQPLFDNPEDAIHAYASKGSTSLRNQALFTALSKAAPKDVAGLGIVRDSEGRNFTQAAGRLPFNVSDEIHPRLKNFAKTWKADNKAINLTIKGLEKTNSASKAILFFGAPFHYFNGLSRFLGLTLGSGHTLLASKGLGEAFGASLLPKVYGALENSAREDGTLQFIRENGGVMHPTRKEIIIENGAKGAVKKAWNTASPFQLTQRNMAKFFNTMMITLARAAREYGVETGTSEATALFREYNAALGHWNAMVEGGNSTVSRIINGGGLAPSWTRTQFNLVRNAGKSSVPVKGVGDAKHGFGLYNAGDVARTTVIGTRVVESAAAVISSALLTGQMPTFHQLLARAGLLPNNPIPNIDAGEKNQKGQHQVIELPTDPLGLGAGLVTDPKHFTQSRFSPVFSTIERAITNQSWNGQPLVDKNQPGWQGRLALKTLEGDLPIGVQNFTNPNLSAKQGVMQEVGGRIKTDPNDPQVRAQQQYFSDLSKFQQALSTGNLSAIDPSLKNVTPTEGQQILKAYQGLHPGGTVDPTTGITVPKNWNALSAQQKASYYLSNDQNTGAQQLTPLFYIDKLMAQHDPSRPHEPLFDLSGSGVGVDGSPTSKAQIAIEYADKTTGDAQRSVMLAANPWLKDYEKAVADYSKNYIPNMTAYMQKQGWTPQAIQQYWTMHPQGNDPVKPPDFDQPSNDVMTQYQNITDPTARSQFFSQHADLLSGMMDQEAQYVTKKRLASGDLALQGYPAESDHVKQILSSMPPGDDKASKKARAQLINNNADVRQYLADVSLHDATTNLSRYQYVDPAHPDLNEGQLLNLGDRTAQKTLKDIQSLGLYDIGKDPLGNFAFMQNGGMPNSSFVTGQQQGTGHSQYSKKNKKVFLKRVKPHRQRPIRISKSQPRKTFLKYEHKLVQNKPLRVKPNTVKPIRVNAY